MKVITFFLMMVVALGGGLLGYRLITGRDLVTPDSFGFAPATQAAPKITAIVPTRTPTPASTATPVPTPKPPEPTSTPTPEIRLVANTDGLGVYIRKTPNLGDRLKAYQEGTKMEVIEKDVQGGGATWVKVRAPDGTEGYIPEAFLRQP